MKPLLALIILAACGATRVKVDPVTVQPIHVTVDVNVRDEPKKP
jgi:hypothetical protein